MKIIALLRGVMPTGKNKIPKMSYLVEILKDAGFQEVKTYIQSGNIQIETNLKKSEIAHKIHSVILEKIGADLPIIIKTKKQLVVAIEENPFNESYDFSRIHLVFTDTPIDNLNTKKIENMEFGEEIFFKGSECFYMYLPKNARKKKLNNILSP